MKTYMYEIKSAKGVFLQQLLQELILIRESFDKPGEVSKIQPVPSIQSTLLTTGNHKLVAALLKDKDYIMKEVIL